MKLRDNRDALVAVAATVRIAPPQMWSDRPHATAEGLAVYLPGSGGVALGLHAGMPVDVFLADHAMPGISLEDDGAHSLICVGNRVRGAGGRTMGVVAGKRGGLAPGFIPGQFIGVEAPEEQLEQAVPGMSVAVETYGRGLALLDFPNISLVNCSPRVLDALNVDYDDGKLAIATRAVFPGSAVGPGLGSDPWIGDLEIDASTNGLRFGDVVAIKDLDGRVSRFYRRGYITIGIVSHGPSPVAGHGVGITVLLSGPQETLRLRVVDAGTLAQDLLRWSGVVESEWA